MESFDLNLDNYGLEEILKLFHVSYNLDENQMKKDEFTEWFRFHSHFRTMEIIVIQNSGL